MTPPRSTRRESILMKNRINMRRKNTVSTVTKSQAMMPAAWAFRNAVQLKPARIGAGSMPAWRRTVHTVLGATLMPRPRGSPWMRR